MKYIMFDPPCGAMFPVVFPEHIDHSMIASSIQSQYPGIKPISAGFCDQAGTAWGKSVTLNLSWGVGDRNILRRMMGID